MTQSGLEARTKEPDHRNGTTTQGIVNGRHGKTSRNPTDWPGGPVGRTGEFHNRAQNFSAECRECSSNALHILYAGYSFYEWICDICGTRLETPI